MAGFGREELNVTVEDRQLVIRGKQTEADGQTFLHRGIAARQFQRAFVLAEGIEVTGAELRMDCLTIELARPEGRKRRADRLKSGRAITVRQRDEARNGRRRSVMTDDFEFEDTRRRDFDGGRIAYIKPTGTRKRIAWASSRPASACRPA